MIQSFFSLHGSPDLDEEIARLQHGTRRAPFDPEAVDFVAAVARELVRGPAGRAFPELAALAHWFRRARLVEMAASFRDAHRELAARPRGLVFIVAPANVEVLFIYGWLLSLLAGNATIVRVSTKPSEARDAFFEVVRRLASTLPAGRVLDDSWLLTYEGDDALNQRLSEACDARLIWGGDATVSHFRSIPLKPVAVEATFADRFSLSAFAAGAVLEAEESALGETARRFSNDALWFSQQACSSPRAFFWIGPEAECRAAQARFWPLFETAAERFADEPAAVMARVTDTFLLAGLGAIEALGSPLGALPGRVAGTVLSDVVRERHSGFGLFVEYRGESLLDLLPHLTEKDQTLVCHGLPHGEIEAFAARLPNRSIDRIVHPGQATDFDIVWDGANLFEYLSRTVSLPRH